MKKLLAFLVLVLLVVAYMGGYWPERQRRAEAEGQLASLRAQLELAEARVRLAALLGDLLALTDAVADRNLGQAQDLSSRFFDAVRAEHARVSHADQREALEWMLRWRDPVTVSLARGDHAGLEHLRRVQTRLRQVLGYPALAPPELPVATATPGPLTPVASPAPSPGTVAVAPTGVPSAPPASPVVKGAAPTPAAANAPAPAADPKPTATPTPATR